MEEKGLKDKEVCIKYIDDYIYLKNFKYTRFINYTGVVIEIGERIAPEQGDKGEDGFPGMH